MNKISKTLYDFLEKNIPLDIDYMDLAQLCLGFHCYIDGLPSTLNEGFDKDSQAEAFARLVVSRYDADYGKVMWAYYGANCHSVVEKGHWIEVIASIYKKGDTFDPEREATIRRRILSYQGAASDR